MFNIDNALSHIPELNKPQALEWTKEANRVYTKYQKLDFVPSQCRNKAIQEANKLISARYGVKR